MRRIILLAVILLLTAGLLYVKYQRSASDLPLHIVANLIENSYSDQIGHLSKLARSATYSGDEIAVNNSLNKDLFDRQDIAKAGIQLISDEKKLSVARILLTPNIDKREISREILCQNTPNTTNPSVSVVQVCYSDNSKHELVVYRNEVINKQGERVEYFLELDLGKKRDKRAAESNQIGERTKTSSGEKTSSGD